MGSGARLRLALSLTLIGLFILIVGAKPGWFGWSHTAGVGFVKISVFLLGLGVICAGGLVGLPPLWKGVERTIVSDIGMRLVATGYVVSVISGMADIVGFGSQPPPSAPLFGPVQAAGVVIGQAIIAVGFLMMIPYASLFKHQNSRKEIGPDVGEQ
jgi:hypothetical protein